MSDIRLAGLLAGGLLLGSSSAQAQVVLADDHIDIAIGYASGVYDMHIARDSDGAQWGPNPAQLNGRPEWARFFGGPNTITPRPVGSQYNFIGVPAASPFFNLPDTQVPNKIYLGFGLDDFDPTGVASYIENDPRVNNSTAQPWIRVRLAAVRGPSGGQFSMWQNDIGGPKVWFSTADGIDANDVAIMTPGADFHGNWGLTTAGLYEVDFQVSVFGGPGATNPIVGPLTTYVFEVNPIPEPTSLTMLGFAAFGGTIRFWRRRRNPA